MLPGQIITNRESAMTLITAPGSSMATKLRSVLKLNPGPDQQEVFVGGVNVGIEFLRRGVELDTL